jgi:hypothetical protein
VLIVSFPSLLVALAGGAALPRRAWSSHLIPLRHVLNFTDMAATCSTPSHLYLARVSISWLCCVQTHRPLLLLKLPSSSFAA